MSSNLTTLRGRLRDADPAAGTAGYPADRQTEAIARALAVGGVAREALPAGRDAGATAGRRTPGPRPDLLRSPRRSVLVAAAAAAALAVVATTMGGGGAALRPTSAVAAEMDRLAAGAADPPPSHEYLYTEVRTDQVGGSASMPRATDRHWDTDTVRAWQGDTCNDRRDTTLAPARFFSAKDREAFRAQSGEAALRSALRGWSVSSRGRDLWALDDIPCDRTGTFEHPNPRYAATYPTDPAGFLAKAVADSGAKEGDRYDTPADAVLTILALPYLSTAQRSAALRAFGQAAGEWEVTGHTTVAGVPGVVIRRDLGPVEQEQVIGSQAPGLLRDVLRITDPAHAAEFDSRYAGLAAGTAVRQVELLKVTVVPDLDTEP
jgi:hypothetical protein